MALQVIDLLLHFGISDLAGFLLEEQCRWGPSRWQEVERGRALCRLFERYMKHSYQSAGGFEATYLNVGIIRYYKWLLL